MKKILVVDDSPVDRLLIQRLLEKSNEWQVIAVDDGAAAIELLGHTLVDLIVTDLQMPNVDGLALVLAVKKRWPNLPIVLVTGSGSDQIAVQALQSGAANYSPKSALQKDLSATVRFVLEIADLSHASPAATNQSSYRSGFVLENDCKLIGPLIEHLQSQLPEWSDTLRLQIGMAVGEAMTNAMHHGNLEVNSDLRIGDESDYYRMIRERRIVAPFCDRRVRIQVNFDPEEIQIEVNDEGKGFNPSHVADPTAEENLDKLSGRGLLLIRSFMDEVRHNQDGNHIVMIKRRCQT